MSLDYERIRDAATDKIKNDDDEKYDTNGDGVPDIPKPDPTNPAFGALVHYIAKAIVEEIQQNAQVRGVQVDPSSGQQIKPGSVD